MKIRLFKNKKAVSPLIATVLLIAFAVALGAVVMNWGKGYVEETQDLARDRSNADILCTTEVNLKIIEVDYAEQACINSTPDPDEVNIILENTGTRDIDSLSIRVIGTKSRAPYTVDEDGANLLGEDGVNISSKITKGTAKFFKFKHNDTDYGGVTQIAITPHIVLGGKDVACTGTQMKLENLKACSEIW